MADHPVNWRALTAVACGVVPILIVHLAYWLNIQSGESLQPEYYCNPYFDGCVSTSRAVRSGPGLFWFKAVMLPCAALMAMTWSWFGSWMKATSAVMPAVRNWAVWLGIGGAIALVAYIIFLGTEGPIYAWLRRYGVVFFFGFTALGQLMAARFVWGVFPGDLPFKASIFLAVVFMQWAIGVFSVFKRLIFDDPALIDRLENITEWLMIGAMSMGFVLIGLLLTMRDRTRIVGAPLNR